MKELSPGSVIQTKFVYGSSDSSLFDSLGYVMLGIVSFFIVFIIAGISFVRERTNQTMERLMMTPVRRWQVVLGYTLGFGFFAVLQSIILLAYVKWVLQMTIMGSVITAGFVMILLALSAVCIGAFFSIFSNNEFQVMQFIPIVVIPQIFFSGLISLDTLPYHLGAISKIMPVFYACDALKTITIRGGGLAGILPDMWTLLIFILLFFFMNILALRKYRKI
jgi:ABC-2 type transport system permease protein